MSSSLSNVDFISEDIRSSDSKYKMMGIFMSNAYKKVVIDRNHDFQPQIHTHF